MLFRREVLFSMMRYSKLRRRPQVFLRLFGVSVDQFAKILEKTSFLWEERVLKQYKRPGRFYKLDLSEMILALLLYYRSYITQDFIGYLFGLDNSQVCRFIKRLEPILASVVALSKRKKLSKQEVEYLILDATEQPIERPQKKQRLYYSGKKKYHSLKTEIRVNLKGQIVHVSQTRPGSVHDFEIFKQEPLPPDHTHLFVDSGYQGIHKRHEKVEFPYKSSKHKPLSFKEKKYNTALSRVRIKVENVIAKLKSFKILSHRYRNKRKRYNLKFQIIAGLINLKGGFSSI